MKAVFKPTKKKVVIIVLVLVVIIGAVSYFNAKAKAALTVQALTTKLQIQKKARILQRRNPTRQFPMHRPVTMTR